MQHTLIESLPTNTAFLHFDATRQEGGSITVAYELVLPLDEADCRGTFDHKPRKGRPKMARSVWLDASNNKRIPLGGTVINSTSTTYPFNRSPSGEEWLTLPFRDGAHCLWDNQKMGGLPVIYSIGGKHWALTTPAAPQPTTEKR